MLSSSGVRGIKNIRVIASAGNIQGINFYRKSGFRDYTLALEKKL